MSLPVCPGPLCSLFLEISHGIRIIRLTKLSSAAALSLYVYDYITTLDSEFNIMWQAKIGPGKLVYLTLRYFTLVFLLFVNIVLFLPEASSNVSIHWIRVHWIAGIIIALLIDFMLQVRVYAFYGRSRNILLLLMTAFSMTAGVMSTIAGIIISEENASFINLGPGSYMRMCAPGTLPSSYINFFFVPLLADGTLIFVLVLVKALSNIKKYGRNRNANQFTLILLEDSAICFFATFTSYLVNQLIWIIGSEDYIEFPIGFTIAIGSISCQRLCLGFRKDRYSLTSYVSAPSNIELVVVSSDGEKRRDMLRRIK